MHKSADDIRKKNGRNDAEFPARQLLAHNMVEILVPDEETEVIRSLSRALEDIRDDLTKAKYHLAHLLIRWDLAWNKIGATRKTRHMDSRALQLDPRDRTARGSCPRGARLYGPSAPYRGAEESDRKEDRKIRPEK